MAKDTPKAFDVPETVTVNSHTYFKGTAYVTDLEKQLINREVSRLEKAREEAENGEEKGSDYTKTELNKMSPEDLTSIAVDEMGLTVEPGITKKALVDLIIENQAGDQ